MVDMKLTDNSVTQRINEDKRNISETVIFSVFFLKTRFPRNTARSDFEVEEIFVFQSIFSQITDVFHQPERGNNATASLFCSRLNHAVKQASLLAGFHLNSGLPG